jgi:hypothetical protein
MVGVYLAPPELIATPTLSKAATVINTSCYAFQTQHDLVSMDVTEKMGERERERESQLRCRSAG